MLSVKHNNLPPLHFFKADSTFRFKCGIAYSIMNCKKLDKLKRELLQMRLSPQKAENIASLAKRLGRRKAKRGKEPVYESIEFNDLFPVSIPHHGGKDIPIGTRNSILNQLEDDIHAWEFKLELEGDSDAEEESESENGDAS